MSEIEFFFDEAGDPRARASGTRDVLARFLEEDVQGNAEHALEILQAIEQIKNGSSTGWEEVGNAYSIKLSREGAVIESLFADDEPNYSLTLNELRDVLSGWIKLLERGF